MEQKISDFTKWLEEYGRYNLKDPLTRICYLQLRQEIMTAMVTEGRRAM